MKKILMITVFSLCFGLFGLDHGLINGLEVGYNIYNRTAIRGVSSAFIDQDDSLSIKMTTGYRVGDFRIIGEYTNLMEYIIVDNYRPTQDIFTVKANYQFKNITIEAWHTCSHPVVTANKKDTTKEFTTRGIAVSFYREF